MKKSLFAALFTLALTQPLSSAEIKTGAGQYGFHTSIFIKGVIDTNDDAKFIKLALNIDDAVVILDSNGGLTEPALGIGRAIHFKKFATAIQNKNCASSCSLIWLAGSTRLYSQNSFIGFHAAFYSKTKGKQEVSPEGNALIGAYLNSLGLSDDIVRFATDTKPTSIKVADSSAFSALGIQSRLIDHIEKDHKDHNQALEFLYGPEKDTQKAIALYSSAASNGFAGSQNNLGDLYESGQIVPKNDKYAIYWYTRAAERGEPTAYLSLSQILSKDTNDKAVLREAFKYAILATNNLPKGKNLRVAISKREALRKILSADDIRDVFSSLTAWAPLYQERDLMGDTKK